MQDNDPTESDEAAAMESAQGGEPAAADATPSIEGGQDVDASKPSPTASPDLEEWLVDESDQGEPSPGEAGADVPAPVAIEQVEAPPQGLPKEGELLALHFDPLEMAPFLADEFILWLWFSSERNYTSFPLGDGESVDLWIDDRLTFSAVEEKQVSSTFKGGAPSTLPEAKLSILSGKRIGEAKMGLRRKEAEWSFVMKVRAGQLLMTGLKIPGTVKDGWEEMIYERMYLIDSVTQVMESLFAQFFRVRTSSEWHDKEAPEIRLWLMGDED